ncbi:MULTISPECIES: sigma-70 family RNA polymerase sigma factor [Pontibacillus]|uniref:Sigma-70 family RNA polymerase sigma factor n=1 Tax=Pontibacillus chungwhensis TaxID=265426 RepID=A0ABY8UVC3_9BACI|nr:MULTISPECIES: sigma-70 family RNA polymerase sigma factor [Pontibacillus]MCD5323325.1 sigma-70 family RNA polymerase sigma factor [Pontibacillus sp. HN14]WIF96706.1 sigma-70 family RNA polymerase sigma factor [Pontibacillus chungwhensis]
MKKLIKKAQKGDTKAFLKLFKEYESMLYKTAYLYVKNEEDASDVVQEVAFKSFKNINTLREPDYFKTWIIKIAINCSLDCIKNNKKVVNLDPNYDDFISDGREDLSFPISVKDLIDGLNENEKSVVILKYYYEYTFEEIADFMEIPIGTTKSLLYRSLKKLKERYYKEELGHG